MKDSDGSRVTDSSSFKDDEEGKEHNYDFENQRGQVQNDSQKEVIESASKDPNIVDWDGPDDPENPMNWPSSKKVAAIGIISLITFLSPLASTIISPATPEVMQDFGSTSETLGAFITSVYLLGLTFGPLVIAPLSEMYGRAIIYTVCNFIFFIFNIACALSNSLSALIVFRLFVGIGASCPVTLGSGTIADMVPAEKRGVAMATWLLGPIIGPTFGPLAGSYLAKAKGWRWIFWLVSIVGGAVFIAGVSFIRESYAYVLLKRKTERLRKETGNPHLRSALDTGKTPKELFNFSIVRPIKMLFLSPVVFILSLYMAIIYGYMYLLFTTFPRVFQGQYGFDNGNIGFTYLGTGVGSIIGLFICGAASDRLVAALTRRHGGVRKPEYRLPLLVVGSLIITIGLFLYGWTAEKKVHWIAPIIGTGFLGAGMFVAFMPCLTYLVDVYTVYAASVSAATTVFRSLVGAFLPLAGNSMYDALGVGWGTSLLGFIALAFMPVTLVLWRFGQRIRESRIAHVSF